MPALPKLCPLPTAIGSAPPPLPFASPMRCGAGATCTLGSEIRALRKTRSVEANAWRATHLALKPHSKLVMAAAKTWRRLKGENQLPKVVQGVTFRNGVEVIDT